MAIHASSKKIPNAHKTPVPVVCSFRCKRRRVAAIFGQAVHGYPAASDALSLSERAGVIHAKRDAHTSTTRERVSE